jgi:hypothetical protein
MKRDLIPRKEYTDTPSRGLLQFDYESRNVRDKDKTYV